MGKSDRRYYFNPSVLGGLGFFPSWIALTLWAFAFSPIAPLGSSWLLLQILSRPNRIGLSQTPYCERAAAVRTYVYCVSPRVRVVQLLALYFGHQFCCCHLPSKLCCGSGRCSALVALFLSPFLSPQTFRQGFSGDTCTTPSLFHIKSSVRG